MRSILWLLKNDASLATMLGGSNKVRMLTASQEMKVPYVVLDIEDSDSTNSYNGSGNLDMVMLTVSCVSDRPYSDQNRVGADDVERKVRSIIDGVAPGNYGGEDLLQCNHRDFTMQEDRISNGVRIYKDAEYMVVVRPQSVLSRVSVGYDEVTTDTYKLINFIHVSESVLETETYSVEVL